MADSTGPAKWKVTASGEFWFMKSYLLHSVTIQIISKTKFRRGPLALILQIAKSLRFVELVVNSNSPIFRVVKLLRIGRNLFIHNVLFHMSNGNLT